MNFEPTMKQAVVRRTVRNFAEKRIAHLAAEMDAAACFPDELAGEMALLDYFGLEIPPQYGGAGLDSVSCVMVIEELSRVSAAMGLCISVHNSVAAFPVYEFGNAYQRDVFLEPMARGKRIGTFCLTEPNAGSDASAIETLAIKNGDGYLLNGNKVFVTNGGVSGLNLVFARQQVEKGQDYSVFMVESERAGVEKGAREELMGMRANPVCSIVLHDCYVPLENRLGDEGQGLKIALSSLNGGRIGIGAQALGIAQASLDVSVKYTKERYQFGRTLCTFGGIKTVLAEMAIRIEASRLLVHRASAMRHQRLPHIKEAAMAKLFASETAVDVARKGLQIHGGYGYTKAYPIERYYRDAKVCEIYEGTSEIQRFVIAKSAMAEKKIS
ncbi:MAG: acyl-CoA dehydrogenase family protein, partial [Deltaproteobacteria bacterium]|nr:acyl-CoA dehydrogenase family protein [Deltaproteobacteria bacterium]